MNSAAACDFIERMVLTIDTSVRLPYYLDFDELFRLRHLGLSFQQVKDFITGFNNGIREKLVDASDTEVSEKVVRDLKKALVSG